MKYFYVVAVGDYQAQNVRCVYIHFWTGGIEMKYLKIRWISSYQRKPRFTKVVYILKPETFGA